MKLPLFLFALVLPAFLSASDWPNWRGPNYDGISKETIPATLPDELPVLWTAKK